MLKVNVIGGGLAGVECAIFLARHGAKVRLFEMKPLKYSPAHKKDGFAELVCSNSLKSEALDTASGTLKAEMKMLGSVVISVGERCRVPSGGALAVDRDKFSDEITREVESYPNIEVVRGVVSELPEDGDYTVIATGPLTDNALVPTVQKLCGDSLAFYDAAAPIVDAESVDMSVAYLKSRYDKGEADYLNCPFTKEQYYDFVNALTGAERAVLHDFESAEIFEGCMPVEIMAGRGADTLRFGPLRPVGLNDPVTGERYYAVLQLRAENADRTAYNLVGFQTNLTFPEQKRVFRMIPGLEHAEFVKYGVMHRNTYVRASTALNRDLSVKSANSVFIAGQLSGVEGYMESAMSGLFVGLVILLRSQGIATELPADTMFGAIVNHITSGVSDGQPMNANFGIMPPLQNPPRAKSDRKRAYAERAIASMRNYLKGKCGLDV